MHWLHGAVLAVAVVSLPVAEASTDERDAVVVRALRNPVDKSYRRMVRGMDVFREMRALAPQASLRYRLLPRKPGTDLRNVVLTVVGDSFEAPVALGPDNTFTLERWQQALDEDASVRPNRKAGTMTWRTEVRTPGVAPDQRRLGDLRLECHAGMAAGLVSEDPTAFGRLMSVLSDPRDSCHDAEVRYLFFAERPLFGVTLRAGERQQALSVGQLYAGLAHGRTPREELPYCDCEALLDRTYYLPLGDLSWPDDTVIDLDYMDGPPAAGNPLESHTRLDVAAIFGRGRAVRFENGYEVWAYDYGPSDAHRLARTEWVVLFEPSGKVAKTRLRPALPPA